MDLGQTAIRITLDPESKDERIVTLAEVAPRPEGFGPIGIYDIYQAFGEGTDDPTLAYVELSRALDEGIGAYHDAVNGLPASVEGGYLRMLYLSAVTITTLGIGDIVPTTQLARALVSAESVLGVVVMGLFLNSLFLNRKVVTVVGAQRTEKRERRPR